MCIFCYVSEEFIRQSAKDLVDDESTAITVILSKLLGEPDSPEVKKDKAENANLISVLADPKKCCAKANELVKELDKDNVPTLGNDAFGNLIVFAFSAGYLNENLPLDNEPFRTIMSSCIACYLLGVRDGGDSHKFEMWKDAYGGEFEE